MGRCSSRSVSLESIDEALGSLIAAQIAFGKAALKLVGDGCGAAMKGLKKVDIPRGGGCCDMPEPCWMPVDHGEICCEICRGEVGEICLVVGNEDFRSHDYRTIAAGEDASLVTVSDSAFTLGPKERRTVSVKFKVPERERPGNDSCCERNDYELVIWMQGCRNHYLRWYINELEEGRKTKCCYEVTVCDEPDYVLHWYDHFHIYRPCPGPETAYKP
ncbi:MAG TPA: hypothetical protein VE175_05780 [Woeseiaceae bacterium]|nr:hypothetical protein [Woeseiaceae bacterium]